MSTTYNFWLEYPSDWRPLRNFFYDACNCTHFSTGAMTSEQGPPDNEIRASYSMHNRYNLVGLSPPLLVENPGYVNDVCVTFTFNKGVHIRQWEEEVIDACIRWLARSKGDAILDLDSRSIFGRQSGGPIIVSYIERTAKSSQALWVRDPVYQSMLISKFEREGLVYEIGALDPLDMTPLPPADPDDEIGDEG